jgi:hypothetical protein
VASSNPTYRKVAVFVGSAVLGVVVGTLLYAKGWVAGERNGRMWGEVTGQYKGMAALTNAMTRARFKDVRQ